MILAIECIVLCIVFSLVIMIPLYKNPIGQIMSYPKKIRERVESLPQYKDSIKKTEKTHVIVKILSIFVFPLILTIIAYLSGARTPFEVFRHVFILFFAVNLYDTVVMDIIIFRNVKVFRIPGTEDMDKEYKECSHHIIGFFIGTGIGLIVSLLSMLYIKIYYMISL